jgi:uncharacterized repeat protein (TIGR01451 family)
MQMPIRRSVLSAIGLLIFGTAVLYGQQNDPFAEWDRQNPSPTAKKSAPKAQVAGVQYFSPGSEEVSSEDSTADTPDNKAFEAARQRMRERIETASSNKSGTSRQSVATANSARTGTMSSPASARTAKPAVEADRPVAEWDVSTATGKLKNNGTAKTSADRASRPASSGKVQPAAFGEAPRNVGKKIVQVSQSDSDLEVGSDSAEGEEENPFASYLEKSSSSNKSAEMPPEFSEQVASGDEDEKAEALLNSAPASRKAAPVARPSAELSSAKTPAAQAFGGKSAPAKPVATKSVPAETVPVKAVSATRSAEVLSPAGSGIAAADSGPQSPGVTVQWVRRGEFNVGQECDIDLVVQNTSKSSVRSVMTEASIPEGLELVEAKPSAMEGSETPTWTFGELKPGEARTVAMKVIPRQRGDVRLDAFVRMTGFSSSEFSVQEPLISVEVSGPETVEVGQQAGYVVKVSNPGTGLANNVVIQAAIPEGLEHRSGSILSIDIGTLNAGESRQAKLSLTAVKGGVQDVAVRAIASGDLTDETTATVTVAEPQLKIAISGPEEQLAGRTSNYTMSVSNGGGVPSENVRAKYRIPEGFEFVSANRGGKYSKTDHSIEWFVGTLQPDGSSDFSLTLRATEPGELLHQAGVISEHGQVTMCDYNTVVEGMAALDLKIVSSSKDLAKGDDVTWEVRIRNTGSREASNVGMSCELPSGIQLVDAEGPSEHIAENGVMVFRSLPAIAPDEEVAYSIRATCLREGNHRLRLRVASESISEPLIGEESATVVER